QVPVVQRSFASGEPATRRSSPGREAGSEDAISAPRRRPSQVLVMSAPRLQRKCDCHSPAGISGPCEGCEAKPSRYQAKIAIGNAGDTCEQQADQIADQVLAQPPHSPPSGVNSRIVDISRPSTQQLEAAPPSVDSAVARPGGPLAPALRRDMEQRFGYD